MLAYANTRLDRDALRSRTVARCGWFEENYADYLEDRRERLGGKIDSDPISRSALPGFEVYSVAVH